MTLSFQVDERPILAIDTSSAQGGVAFYDGRRLSVRSWPAERSHTTTLLSEIHHVLDAERCDVHELAAIAVATGPGAFTGLRAGFGVAKGFHLAADVPLIGVSTLEATALPFAVCGQPIVAAIAAGRGRLVWARYHPGPSGLVELAAPRNGTAADLVAALKPFTRTIVTGELDADQAALVAEIDGVALPPAPLRIRQPGAVAEIGWQRLRAGRIDDAAAIEPVYLSR